jgi:glycosyltransferase involved in cell wall biosynthesis
VAAVPPDDSIIDRLGLRGRKYFLSVGAGNNKNVETVIAAFKKANLTDALVVVTGYRQQRVNGSRDDILTEGVRNAGYVSDAELHALYQNALALVCPSRYEGFGLPPVEAMACGCPVIVSNQPALLEICGAAALHCDADDSVELSRLMRVIHDDPIQRARLIAAGRDRVARFTWRATARVLLDVCVQAASTQDRARLATQNVPQAGESF